MEMNVSSITRRIKGENKIEHIRQRYWYLFRKTKRDVCRAERESRISKKCMYCREMMGRGVEFDGCHDMKMSREKKRKRKVSQARARRLRRVLLPKGLRLGG